MYRTTAFLPLSPAFAGLKHGHVLLRIAVYAVAVALILLQGWLAHRLLSSPVSAEPDRDDRDLGRDAASGDREPRGSSTSTSPRTSSIPSQGTARGPNVGICGEPDAFT
jgi:hypothetical protein